MPEVQVRKRLPARVPDIKGMKQFRCADEKCNAFLGYEAIKIGLIQKKCHRHGCKQVTQVTAGLVDGTALSNLIEVRCGNCGRFLYGEAIVEGKTMVKCDKCGQWHTMEITP